jgi:benzoylformate decarboxylase
MSMADGFTMASGEIGVVNVHAACGLGNSMGMLYNAHIERTPLLLTAGQQDRRLRLEEPVLDADLVSVARPWTKWSHEVQRVQDIPLAVRRAIQVAKTPPTGPVFLSLPLDVQREEAPGCLAESPTIPDARMRPSREGLERAARLLREARSPAILAGSRVQETNAVTALVRVAERLGAPVHIEGTATHGRLPMPTEHPLNRGVLSHWADEIHRKLGEHDVLLVIGTSLFRLYIYREPARPLANDARVIHLDNVPWEIGKNCPTEVGLLGDPREGLLELAELLHDFPKELSSSRTQRWTEIRRQEQQKLLDDVSRQSTARPMSAAVFMHAMARVLPENIAVVEEAITSHQNIFERLGAIRDPSGFFAHRGWALGWGMGCALGVKLAWPDRPVLGLIGDGSALYGIQALWSAARHQIPVTFVIANNSQYRILKVCGEVLDLTGLSDPRCVGIQLGNPAVDYVGLARSLGVDAERVTEPDELSERVRASLRGDHCRLIDVALS